MAQQQYQVQAAGPEGPKMARRKTPGACERCREKRIKCDGFQPCDQCSKRGHKCIFTFLSSTGNEIMAEKLDRILSRLDHLQEAMNRRSLDQLPDRRRDKSVVQHYQTQPSCVTQLNQHTGCIEHYGSTSAFALASSLSKRINQLEEDAGLSPKRVCSTSRSQNTGPSSTSPRSENLGLDELLGFHDYIIPANTPFRPHRCLQREVADRHLDSFFRTVHVFLPIFNISTFRERYTKLESLLGDNRLFVPRQENLNQQQFVCLLHVVLALGALYEDEREDSSSWASWYFAEAQEMLGRLFDAVSLELVQAAMLMGAYAQHTIKPSCKADHLSKEAALTNLVAYNLAGISTRLAFSIGLNIESTHGCPGLEAEERRRTWWLVYIQEVELSLDSGRPMSIRSCDVNTDYPLSKGSNECSYGAVSQVDFIRCLAEVAKIIRKILKLVNDAEGRDNSNPPFHILMGTFHDDLLRWRNSLPKHLRFHEEHMDSYNPRESPYDWKARQRSSIRIHYNLAVIISHRAWEKEKTGGLKLMSDDVYKASSLDAARDMIVHIHELFMLAPSLRRWSYYCFYCLQATLVLFTKITDEPSSEGTESLKALCQLSIQVFEHIKLKAAKRCAEIVRQVLDQLVGRKVVYNSGDELFSALEDRSSQSRQHTSLEALPWSFHPPSLYERGNRLTVSQGLNFEPHETHHPETQDLDLPSHSSEGAGRISSFTYIPLDESWPLQVLEGFATSFEG